MGSILDASGIPTSSGPKQVKKDSVPRADENLSPKEVSRLDFHPFGTRLIAEAVAPDTVTEGGVYMPFGGDYKAYYRVLRLGSKEYKGNIQKLVELGDVVFTRATQSLMVHHTYPYLEKDGVKHDRVLLMLDYHAIDGVIPGQRWKNPEESERKVGEMPIADFSEEFVETVMTEMATPKEAEAINFIPMSDKILVERVPSMSSKGSILIPEAGQQKLPFFRVIKMSESKENFPPHAKNVEVGDLLLILNVNPQIDAFPTNLKNAQGQERDIFLTSVSFAIGSWPSLSLSEKKDVVQFKETSKTTEKA